MYVLCAKSTHFRAFINHNKNYNTRNTWFVPRMEARLKVKIKYFFCKIFKTLTLFQVVRYMNKNFNNPLKIPKNIGVKLPKTLSGLRNGKKF